MYLSQLNLEKKHLFLDLELYISKTDGDFSDGERAIIDSHCIEMQIDNNNYTCELPLDEVISMLSSKCSVQEKHIVFLELAATVLADEVYRTSEKQLMKRLAETLDISCEDTAQAFTLIRKMKDAYEGCAQFVMGE